MKFKKFILLILLILTGCNDKNQKILGYIESDYYYISSTISGIIEETYVTDGQEIKKGTPLIKIDNFDFLIEENNIKAQIEESIILLSHYQKDYEDAIILFDKKSISENDLKKAEDQYINNKTKLILLKNNLKIIQKKIKDLSPSSLIDGYVDKIFYLKGEFVSSGKPILTLFDPKKIKIIFFVPQDKIQAIKIGKEIKFKTDACDKELLAKISFISNELEYTPPVIFSTESRKKLVFMVEAKYENYTDSLRPGQPIEVIL